MEIQHQRQATQGLTSVNSESFHLLSCCITSFCVMYIYMNWDPLVANDRKPAPSSLIQKGIVIGIHSSGATAGQKG